MRSTSFDKRVKVLIAVFALMSAGLSIRLGQLQIVQGDHYRRLAEQSRTVTTTWLPFVRGNIRDRTGEILVGDEAQWDVRVDYRVLAAAVDPSMDTLSAARVRWRPLSRRATAEEKAAALESFRVELAAAWDDLASLAARVNSREIPTSFHETARTIVERVRGVRRAVARRRGYDDPIAEETQTHSILAGLTNDQRVAAQERLFRYPWIDVAPSSHRRYTSDGITFAHILGRLGPVDAERIASDPGADDPFSEYRADERIGISGVESFAESRLRGRRGRYVIDRDGVVVDWIDAEDGADAVLTLHAPLQRALFELLGKTVRQIPDSTGGAIVVLDVSLRETLALISYPSYDPAQFQELFSSMRDDTDRMPLLFRAVTAQYPPGSTIKPLVGLAGLINGKITVDSTEHCSGRLFENQPDRWRCWEIHGTNIRKAHGDINLVEALTGSCNVFLYRLGENLGVDRLCSAFDMAGIGRTSGIGLPEEAVGINPTPAWLQAYKQASATPGSARLFAIGQGEVSTTPVQVANLLATYASGRFRPVTLLKTDDKKPEWTLPGTREHWSAVRQGVYGVVNDADGTAYKYAHWVNEHYALCGKTGSATAHRRPTSYRVPYRKGAGDHDVAIIREGSRSQAIDRFRRENPTAEFDPAAVEVASRWPPREPTEGENFAHAWFGGFLQPLDSGGQPDWSRTARIAFAVLVEYGGSGGQTSGPLARSVADTVIRILGPDLHSDASPAAEVRP